MTIDLRIDHDMLSIVQTGGIVSGSKNYYVVKCIFTPDWDELNKFLVLSTDGENFSAVCLSQDEGGDEFTAVLPEGLIQESGSLVFGVIGKDGDTLRISTNLEKLKIIKGASETDCPPPTPEEGSAWDKYIQGEINKIRLISSGVVSLDSSVDGAYLLLQNGDKHLSSILLEAGNYIIIEPEGDDHITIKSNIPNANTTQKGLMTSTQVSTLNKLYSSLGGYAVGGTGEAAPVWGYIPVVKGDGGTELGQYVDLHLKSEDGTDRIVRMRIYKGDNEDFPTIKFEGSSYGSLANIFGNHIHATEIHGDKVFGTAGFPLKMTVNGTEFEYALSSASADAFSRGVAFYAPKTAGNVGQILKSNGSGTPVWIDSAPLATAFKSGKTTVTLAGFYNAFITAVNELSSKAHVHEKSPVGQYTGLIPGKIIVGYDETTITTSGVSLDDLLSQIEELKTRVAALEKEETENA